MGATQKTSFPQTVAPGERVWVREDHRRHCYRFQDSGGQVNTRTRADISSVLGIKLFSGVILFDEIKRSSIWIYL